MDDIIVLSTDNTASYYFIRHWLACFKIINILQGDLGYLGQRFIGKKALVAGDQYIRKAHEPHDLVIGNDLFRQIMKEQLLLLFVHIDAQVTYLSGL